MRKIEALHQIKVMTMLYFFYISSNSRVTGALPSSLPFADYANLISPSTRSQWGGGGGNGARKEGERVRHATIRRIAQSQSHTPRVAFSDPSCDLGQILFRALYPVLIRLVWCAFMNSLQTNFEISSQVHDRNRM